MQVKQRLRINAVVTIVSVIAILVVIVLTFYRVNRVFEASEIADRILTTAFERLTLRTDYLRTSSERSAIQFIAKQGQISGLLKTASEKFTDPEDKITVSELIKNNESLENNFRAVVENRGKMGPSARPDAIVQQTEDRLLNQWNIRLYEMVLLGGKLQDSGNAALASALTLGAGGILFVLLLGTAAILINSWNVGRAITDRVGRLCDDASVIGNGDLDHRIDVKGDDEFAELSDAFNSMTAKLSGSYHDLNNEIEEHKRAEEELRKAREELEMRVQERTQELTELNATLDQRIIERTAELQAANDTLRASRVAALNLMEDALDAGKQAEESELFYRQTLESIPGMVFTTRPDGYCDYQSQQWVEFTGVPMREHLGDGWNRLLHPDDRPKAFAAWRAAVEGRAPYDLEYRVRRHDGEYKWFKVIGRPIRDVTGQIVKWFGVAANIDAIKQSEESLRQSEERFRGMFERHKAIMLLVDPENGAIVDANPSAVQFYGYSHEELCKMMIADINQLPPDEVAIVLRHAATADKGHFVFSHKLADGQVRWVEVYTTPFETGERRLLFSIIHDITDRREAEEALKQSNASLANVNKELESFVYSASHDLHAPLRHISAFADLAAKQYGELLDEKGKSYLVRICNSASKMTGIIDDLLRLSRVSRQEIRSETVDLSKMVSKIITELRESDAGRNVEAVIQEGLLVHADRRLMEVAFSNLVGNAWKYTSKTGNARLEFGVFEENGQSVYYLRDNGAGFDQKLADRMFLPFHRLHTAAEFEGTGVGLAIVERVINRHGGKIWAEGEVGKGATVYIKLHSDGK